MSIKPIRKFDDNDDVDDDIDNDDNDDGDGGKREGMPIKKELKTLKTKGPLHKSAVVQCFDEWIM